LSFSCEDLEGEIVGDNIGAAAFVFVAFFEGELLGDSVCDSIIFSQSSLNVFLFTFLQSSSIGFDFVNSGSVELESTLEETAFNNFMDEAVRNSSSDDCLDNGTGRITLEAEFPISDTDFLLSVTSPI